MTALPCKARIPHAPRRLREEHTQQGGGKTERERMKAAARYDSIALGAPTSHVGTGTIQHSPVVHAKAPSMGTRGAAHTSNIMPHHLAELLQMILWQVLARAHFGDPAIQIGAHDLCETTQRCALCLLRTDLKQSKRFVLFTECPFEA